MKKYTSRATKWLGIVTLICVVVLLAGIILICSEIPTASIAMIILGGLLGILFFCCFLAEKSRGLIIDTEKIIFPRGAEKNGERLLRKTVIRFEEVMYVKSTFHKGDVILTGDCFFHTLTLKDGSKVTVTLYAYGKEAETEIIETILKKTTQS